MTPERLLNMSIEVLYLPKIYTLPKTISGYVPGPQECMESLNHNFSLLQLLQWFAQNREHVGSPFFHPHWCFLESPFPLTLTDVETKRAHATTKCIAICLPRWSVSVAEFLVVFFTAEDCVRHGDSAGYSRSGCVYFLSVGFNTLLHSQRMLYFQSRRSVRCELFSPN